MQSINYKCETCGRVADLLPELKLENEHEQKPSKYTEQIAQLHMHSLESASPSRAAKDENEALSVTVENGERGLEEAKMTPVVAQNSAETQEQVPLHSKPASAEKESTIDADESTDTAPALAEESTERPTVTERHPNCNLPIGGHDTVQVRESDSVDTLLHYLTVAIVIALFALIYKKLLQTYGVLQ